MNLKGPNRKAPYQHGRGTVLLNSNAIPCLSYCTERKTVKGGAAIHPSRVGAAAELKAHSYQGSCLWMSCSLCLVQ